MQVELQMGEMLEILESVETANGLWYKIAPPSGEFRWVASTDLDREPPGQWPAPGQSIAASGPPSAAAAPNLPPSGNSVKPTPSTNEDWQTANLNKWREDAARNQLSTPPMPAGGQPLVLSSQPGAIGSVGAATNVNPERSFQFEYEQLESDIAALLVEDPAAWSFGSLNKRSDELLSRAGIGTRSRARSECCNRSCRVLRIFKQRSLDAKAIAQSKGTPSPIGAGFTSTRVNNTGWCVTNPIAKLDQANADQGRFDGIGKLMPVLARRANAPKYATGRFEQQYRVVDHSDTWRELAGLRRSAGRHYRRARFYP